MGSGDDEAPVRLVGWLAGAVDGRVLWVVLDPQQTAVLSPY